MITIPSIISSLAASPRTASSAAIIGDETVTFEQLHQRSLCRVTELRELGVGSGSIVALVAYNEAFIFEYLVAAGCLGAALMPLSPALTDRELNALAEKTDAAAFLCTPQLDSKRVPMLTAPGRPTRVVVPSSGEAASDLEFPSADSTCWVSTTGGSTGTPRLFAMSHERLLTNLLVNTIEWDLSHHGAYLAISPLAHGIGFSHAVGQLATGGAVALVERYSPTAAIDTAARTKRCWTAIVPTMLHDLLQHSFASRTASNALELVVCAGAPLPVGLRDRALAAGHRIVEYYGSTELGWVASIDHQLGEPRSGLVGMPTMGTTIRIVDATGGPLPGGVVGRVEKRGRPYAIPLSGGPSAYHANASAWETSNDVGYIDEDGSLILTGREDDMVVVGGQNVYPVEVEAALREHTLVREVLVRGESSDRLGQQLVAFVEPVPGAVIETGELASFCEARLAKYKRPSRISVVDALPRNAAGKISRGAPVSLIETKE